LNNGCNFIYDTHAIVTFQEAIIPFSTCYCLFLYII